MYVYAYVFTHVGVFTFVSVYVLVRAYTRIYKYVHLCVYACAYYDHVVRVCVWAYWQLQETVLYLDSSQAREGKARQG